MALSEETRTPTGLDDMGTRGPDSDRHPGTARRSATGDSDTLHTITVRQASPHRHAAYSQEILNDDDFF